MRSILVVEDDKVLNKLICSKLKIDGFKAIPAFDGSEAIDVMDKEFVDLIICDVMMPKINGFELTKILRETNNNLPILMITAKDQLEDIEEGFESGIDDYMIKPINLKEMMLRVNALLRRAKISSDNILNVGQTTLDYETMLATVNGESIELAPKEFKIIFLLLSNPNKIYTRLDILDQIWGLDSDVDERTIDTHIKKLRKKFENQEDFEIATIRGLGYKISLIER